MSGSALRMARQATGASTAELAALVGVSQATISRLERGLADTPLRTKIKIARLLECPVGQLFPPERS